MKTKNNIQKTVLKSVAAATGLAILSLTVHAQGVLKSFLENDGTGHIAMVIENATHNSFAANTYSGSFINAETFAAYLEAENELPLNVEDWMIEVTNFEMWAEIEAETEYPLEIENWMTNENTFNGFAPYLEAETESPLQVEEWMTDDRNFGSFSALLETETESEMVVENWMITENILSSKEQKPKLTKKESQPISTATYFYREVNIEEKLEIESWMLNSKVCGK